MPAGHGHHHERRPASSELLARAGPGAGAAAQAKADPVCGQTNPSSSTSPRAHHGQRGGSGQPSLAKNRADPLGWDHTRQRPRAASRPGRPAPVSARPDPVREIVPLDDHGSIAIEQHEAAPGHPGNLTGRDRQTRAAHARWTGSRTSLPSRPRVPLARTGVACGSGHGRRGLSLEHVDRWSRAAIGSHPPKARERCTDGKPSYLIRRRGRAGRRHPARLDARVDGIEACPLAATRILPDSARSSA